MKKLLLIICLVFAFHSSKAQLHDVLKQTDWHIFHLILKGVEYPTPIFNVVGIVDPNIVFEEDIMFAVVDPFSDSFFSDVTYDPVENAFVLINPSISLPGCHNHCEFAAKYWEFLWGDGENVPFTYEITDLGLGELGLRIMDEFDNEAYYLNHPILGVNDLATLDFIVYPNPVSNVLFVSSENAVVENIAVYNFAGQLVLEQAGDVSQVDVSILNQGIYFAEITSEEGRSVQKFIKQ